MSKLVDLLRDRVRLALHGAREERVIIGTWKRTAKTLSEAFDRVLALTHEARIMRTYDRSKNMPRMKVLIDAEDYLHVLEYSHGREHPTTVHFRFRLETELARAKAEETGKSS